MVAATQRFTFTGACGGKLAARLDLPVGIPKCFALFAHCFTCTKDIFAASRIAESLTDKGIAVLRFDFTGLGSSEGEFANSNFSSNVGDLVAAANHMREHLAAPEILIGHSLGGVGRSGGSPAHPGIADGGNHRRACRSLPCGAYFQKFTGRNRAYR